MKKIINGKMYNTETAVELGTGKSHLAVNNFGYYEEHLYRKKTGEYFLYGEGGAGSKYAKQQELNSFGPGDGFTPLTESGARIWAEKYLDADEYCEIFGEPEE